MNRVDEKADELTELRRELGEIELNAMEYTLADAMRDGSRVTKHAVGSFGDGATACGLTAAIVGAKSAGYIK